MRLHGVIKTADWVVDLGPGDGVNGGEIVVASRPETVANTAPICMWQYLRRLLDPAAVKPN
jgi:excinuclease ABC subunit A